MATNVTYNATQYAIPAQAEEDWGNEVSSYLIALATGSLTKSGGVFTLTAEADFGASHGLKSLYFRSRGTAATTGVLRLGNTETLSWRNAANSADVALTTDSNNRLTYGGADVVTASSTDTLTNKTIDADGTGNSITNIEDANIKAGADISFSKMENLTANRALTSDGSGDVSASAVTSTELGHLDGVTSGIQGQLNGKAGTALDNLTVASLAAEDLLVAASTSSVGRLPVGTNGQVLTVASSAVTWANPAGTGDVTGPASSTDNALPRFDGTSGKNLQASGVLVDDIGRIVDGTSSNSLDLNGVLGGVEFGADSPVFTIKDTNSAGDAANPYIQWYDSTDTRLGYIGVGSSSSSNINLTADSGNIFFNSVGKLYNFAGNSGSLTIDNSTANYLSIRSDLADADTLEFASLGSVDVVLDYNNNSSIQEFRVLHNALGGGGTELFKVGEDGVTTFYDGLVHDLYTGAQTAAIKVAVAGVSDRAWGSHSGSTSGRTHMDFSNPNGTVGSIATSGSATAFNTSSDKRLKKDPEDFDGLAFVSAMEFVKFKWISDDTVGHGVMAQDLYKVFPRAVSRPEKEDGTEDETRTWGVDYSKLVPILGKAIKELKAENDALLARIEALENA